GHLRLAAHSLSPSVTGALALCSRSFCRSLLLHHVSLGLNCVSQILKSLEVKVFMHKISKSSVARNPATMDGDQRACKVRPKQAQLQRVIASFEAGLQECRDECEVLSEAA
ncbi:hypothetical protein GOP47_0003510, partial [Adiantum capillus-veneris]